MIGTTFNEQLNIVEVKFKGNIELDELLHFIFCVGQNKFLPEHCNMLVDATESSYCFSASDLEPIARNIEANTSRFKCFLGAFIHGNANDTALSIAMQRQEKFSTYRHKTFCTREAALAWIGVPIAV